MDTYHGLGHQTPDTDPSYPQSRMQPAPPQFIPPIAPGPNAYQQGGSSYSQHAPNMQQSGYGRTPQSGYGGTLQPGYQTPGTAQEQGYFPPQPQAGVTNNGAIGGLASQMGQMGLGPEAGAASRPNRKKNRHAYHDIDQPGGSQPFGGMPQGGMNSPQFLNANSPQSTSPGNMYAGQRITPEMNQFPAQAGAQLTTGPQPIGPNFSEKVDPEQIPSIARSRDVPAKYYLDHIYHTMEQHLPPPGAIPFVAYDQGNSSPKYARLTFNSIPSTSEALNATALPLGLLLQPLAPLQDGEQAIPVLDFGEQGPPRCRRCRAYINPFMTFRSGGNKFVCNMCTFPNDVAPEYFAPTDPNGIRVDRAERHELTMGTVEFMVPKEYWAKEPVGLRWLFVIDVSQEAVSRGLLEAFCEGILGALYSEDQDGADDENQNDDEFVSRRRLPAGAKVGFVTYDREIHFYNCHVSSAYPGLTQKLISVIGKSGASANASDARYRRSICPSR